MERQAVYDLQRIVILQARTVCAQAKIESMKVANLERQIRGESPAYAEECFLAVIDEEGIGHNDAHTTIYGR